MKKYKVEKIAEITFISQHFIDTISEEIFNVNKEKIHSIYNEYIRAHQLLDYLREYQEGDAINGVSLELYNVPHQREAFLRARKKGARVLVYVKADIITNFFPLGDDGGFMFTDEDLERSAKFNLENVIRHAAYVKTKDWVKENLVPKNIPLEVLPVKKEFTSKATTINQNVKYYHQLLTNEECDRLLEFYKKSNDVPAAVMNNEKGAEVQKSSRSANVVAVPYDNPDINILLERVSSLLGINKKQIEIPQIVKYDIGGEYKPHHDFFTAGNEFHDNALKQGGNRKMTMLVYLNDNFEGGETHFPLMGVVISPLKGHALLWKNLNDRNESIHNSLHAGMPVTQGSKYIIPLWIRERNYIN